MKKQPLLLGGIIVAVLLIVGGLIYWQTAAKNDNKTTTSSSSSSTTSNSILGISDSGKAQKCTMSYSGDNGSGTGTIYTDGEGQGRYIFSTETEKGNSGEINQVLKDGTSYAWFESNGKTIGFKIKIDPNDVKSTAGNASSPNLNSKFEMKCKSWTVDESQFQIPSDVSFIDASALSPTN